MLSRIIYNSVRRIICENKQIFRSFEVASKFNTRQYNLCINYSYLRHLNPVIQKRFKSKKQTTKQVDYDNDEDEEESVEVDEYLQTDKSKVINTTVTSLRVDVIVKAALKMSRMKIDKAFYNSNIRINGERCLKKGSQVEVDDEIDIVVGRTPNNPGFLIVHRCIVLSASPDEDTIKVKLLSNKSLLIEDYNDPWNGVAN